MRTLLAAALLAASGATLAQNTVFNSPSNGYPGASPSVPVAVVPAYNGYPGYQQPAQQPMPAYNTPTYTPPVPQYQPMPVYTAPPQYPNPALGAQRLPVDW